MQHKARGTRHKQGQRQLCRWTTNIIFVQASLSSWSCTRHFWLGKTTTTTTSVTASKQRKERKRKASKIFALSALSGYGIRIINYNRLARLFMLCQWRRRWLLPSGNPYTHTTYIYIVCMCLSKACMQRAHISSMHASAFSWLEKVCRNG